ncbi:MAG TPA: hypothetical protein PKX87_06095, partial [Alphaproteobacteria bacterium]|nr:hypothetical protein [Alphaproteobacteria bacterium]
MTVENDAGLGRLRAAFGASEREVDEGILKVCRMNDTFLGGFLGALSAVLPGEDTQDRVCEVLPDLTQAWRDFAALGALASSTLEKSGALAAEQRSGFTTAMTRHAP